MTDQPQSSADAPLAPDAPPPTPSAAQVDAPRTQARPAPPPAVSLPPELPPGPPGLAGAAGAIQEKPELAVGGAFAGGLVLALILKRLAR